MAFFPRLPSLGPRLAVVATKGLSRPVLITIRLVSPLVSAKALRFYV
jgi:hypothetical protein